MRMKVICGDTDCREEFYVDSKDGVWECPNCSREIINRNYPFLTAKLMQAKIDGDEADWKNRFGEIIEEARIAIEERKGERDVDLSFIDDAEKSLSMELSMNEWKEKHDDLLIKAREIVLELEK